MEYFTFLTTELTTNTGGSLLNEKLFLIGYISIGAILWTGWVTCAYHTIYALKAMVNGYCWSSRLKLDIYNTTTVFSSLFAYALLGETLGLYGYVGCDVDWGYHCGWYHHRSRRSHEKYYFITTYSM